VEAEPSQCGTESVNSLVLRNELREIEIEHQGKVRTCEIVLHHHPTPRLASVIIIGGLSLCCADPVAARFACPLAGALSSIGFVICRHSCGFNGTPKSIPRVSSISLPKRGAADANPK
jgi:hypothetical protein